MQRSTSLEVVVFSGLVVGPAFLLFTSSAHSSLLLPSRLFDTRALMYDYVLPPFGDL